MIILKHRTANPFGTQRLWLSKCLAHNTSNRDYKAETQMKWHNYNDM